MVIKLSRINVLKLPILVVFFLSSSTLSLGVSPVVQVLTKRSPAEGGVINRNSLRYEAVPNDGYAFSHWTLTSTMWKDKPYYDNPYNAREACQEESRYGGTYILLTAYFIKQTPAGLSIRFVDADGTQISETQIVKEGENATPPTPPTREGYTFVGWIGAYTNVKSDATIYASYSRNNELSTTQQGSLPGLFSVAPDKQVYFSQGNLQYMGATQTWRFAENQYDTVGIFNNNISSSYNGWIDMFGWGTSGWNSGAKEYQPYSTSTTDADYYPGNTYSNDLTGPYMNADWGIYNAIYNGGNKTGLWRTLTQDEWQYLYSNRANADSKHAYATINGIGGYILLPDNWILPNGLTFDATGTNATANQYTKEQWKLMEQNGAVFLPAAGYRDGSEAKGVLKLGDYWLSTSYDADNACRVFFRSDRSPESYPCELRHYGFSVRLVGPAPSYKIAVNPSNDLMGSTSGSGIYNYGESVQISANPNDCFHFTQWSDGNTDNPRTVIVDGDATYTANFAQSKYTITWRNWDNSELYKADFDYGTTPVYGGAVPTKPADAQYTYTFDSWSPNIHPVQGDDVYTAVFSKTVNQYTVTFKNHDGSVLQSTSVAYGETPVYAGTAPTKPATDEYTYTFSAWTPAIVAVTGNVTYTAEFVEEGNIGPTWQILYTSSDGDVVTPYKTDVFGANIVSNEYKDGEGVITFDGPVTSIGDSAFWSCESLTAITIPNSVTSIGEGALASPLLSIAIPNSVTTIGRGAFANCLFTSITIPNSVTSIGDYAFHYCIYLTSVNLPESVTSIGYGVFYHCESLTSITIPNSVTSIGEEAFAGCASLSSITIPNSVTTIGKTAFRVCGLRSITIPNSVESLGSAAFLRCPHLTSVTIGNGIKSIGVNTFSGCYALTSVTIGSGVTSIGENAFQACSSLTSITIPESVTNIGAGAFEGCDNLKTVYVKAQEPPVLGE